MTFFKIQKCEPKYILIYDDPRTLKSVCVKCHTSRPLWTLLSRSYTIYLHYIVIAIILTLYSDRFPLSRSLNAFTILLTITIRIFTTEFHVRTIEFWWLWSVCVMGEGVSLSVY